MFISYNHFDFVVNHVYVLQVKKYFEKTGYTYSDDKPVIQVLSDDEIVTTTVQNNTAGWSVEKLQVLLL